MTNLVLVHLLDGFGRSDEVVEKNLGSVIRVDLLPIRLLGEEILEVTMWILDVQSCTNNSIQFMRFSLQKETP